MLGNDAIRNRQAETRAALLGSIRVGAGREEWIEHVRQCRLGDARATIPNGDDHIGATGLRREPQGATLRHGLEGVDEQVDEHLVQAVRVCSQRARIEELLFDCNLLATSRWFTEAERFVENGDGIDFGMLPTRLLRKSLQLLDDAGSTFGGSRDN